MIYENAKNLKGRKMVRNRSETPIFGSVMKIETKMVQSEDFIKLMKSPLL